MIKILPLKRIVPLVSLCSILATSAFGALLTGFEASEGFTNGDSGKTIGQWILTANSSITNQQAFAGTQSLKITNTQIVQYNPTVAEIAANYNALSFAVKADAFSANTQIGLWQVLFGAVKAEARLEVKVSFGATASSPIKVEYLNTWTEAGVAPTVYSVVYLENIDLTQWNTITFGINFTEKKYQLKLGDSFITEYSDLTVELNQYPRLARVFLRGNTTTATYYDAILMDNAIVVPEPGAAALLLIPGAWVLLRKRKRSN